MSGLLFVTAPEADHKTINRLLVYLQDWEYGEGDPVFKLVTTRSVASFEQEPLVEEGAARFEPTQAPVDADLQNAWAGATLADVEAFCLALYKAAGSKNANTHQYVVLDADGLADETCVFVERVIDWEADPIRYPDEFNKARVPWYQVYLGWCNLDISNIGWEEMMVEDDAEDVEGRWWTYDASDSAGVYLSKENEKKRDDALRELESEGNA